MTPARSVPPTLRSFAAAASLAAVATGRVHGESTVDSRRSTVGEAVSIGNVLGSSAAFLAGRAVAAEGAKVVFLARLSPVLPFNVLNYAFGLTRVRFREFVLGSFAGMLPGTLLYVYLGSAVQDLADVSGGGVGGSDGQTVLFAAGLAASVLASVLVARIARRALAAPAPAPFFASNPALQGVSHD